jgi:hypothetical protein
MIAGHKLPVSDEFIAMQESSLNTSVSGIVYLRFLLECYTFCMEKNNLLRIIMSNNLLVAV